MSSGDARGDFIGGDFTGDGDGGGQALRSIDPANGTLVYETPTDVARIGTAMDAAAEALPAWRRLGMDERLAALHRFRAALGDRREAIAEALRREVGKVAREAAAETGALLSRFDLIEERVRRDLRDGPLPGHPNEALVHQPHGVVGVVGPFNFPLHLCHAHVVPALLLGNTVVLKPSEVAPLAAHRYAEAAAAAGLPPGVLNVVHGRGAAGAALVAHRELRALAFTGSWPTGRTILEALLDRPEGLVALEMGGKNVSVVAEDADLRQAAHEIVVGGYLTTGQRCTCTDRVLVHRRLVEPLTEAVARLVRSLRLGDPTDPESFAGPLATETGREKLLAALQAARQGGAQEVARGWASDRGPGFVPPTVHRLPAGTHRIPGYTDVELFGPDVGIEVFDDDDEALALLTDAPGGLAYSVFSARRDRFEHFVGRVPTGILNWNRSTNQASPRLPFGGVGKAGNFRPAGAYAPRNLAIPVAVQSNQPRAFAPNPLLVPHLPAPDLDELEAQHRREEAREAERSLGATPRPEALSLPPGGHLPTSEALQDRLYAGDRVVREKKPPVVDALRSRGPWLVSVDRDPPLSVLDGMSQTATLPAGFAPDPVVRAYVEGGFGETLVRAGDGARRHPAAEAFADRLRAAVPGLPEVSFVNGGAESCEKALALCHAAADDPVRRRRVLAFEGSFHGRTLLALGASHNPAKRAPFEIAGYEVDFAPFPVWWEPQAGEPPTPTDLSALVAAGKLDEARARYGWTGDAGVDRERDCLLADELASLTAVDDQLAAGETFAVLVEPMQSEGGDRYGTGRFFRMLRLLTRRREVPLIIDEVQTGFGLGGPVAWHAGFALVDADGRPDAPDCVTFAKRAQVGVVMSHFPDPEPTSSHPASLVRGHLHLDLVEATADRARRLEAQVRRQLDGLVRAFPDLIAFPRARGYALAFDLPSPAHLGAYLAQRFWRGAVVFGAGSQTVRYRLSAAWTEAHVERLFVAIRRSLAWLEASPGVPAPAWMDVPGFAEGRAARAAPSPGGGRQAGTAGTEAMETAVRIRRIRGGDPDAGEALQSILALEARVYEPARRDPEDRLRLAFDHPQGVALVAEVAADQADGDPGAPEAGGWRFAGYALAAPLEAVAEAGVPGVVDDPFLGRENTIYSLALSVRPDLQGQGIGRRLKHAQLEAAAGERREDGSPRYRHLTARNRVGRADAMTRLAVSLGATEVARLSGQYGDPDGEAIYYRLPLGAFAPDPASAGPASTDPDPTGTVPNGTAPNATPGDAPPPPALDWRATLAAPLAEAPDSLRSAEREGLLYGPATTKLTLSNYATPATVRAVEWVATLTPGLPHLYLTSSRDETLDKSLRLLRVHRTKAQVALGLRGGYLGHTTAAARSLSDPAVHRGGPAYYRGFQRVPHPGEAGVATTIRALEEAIQDAGGPDRVLGLWVEPVQERTGWVLPARFGPALAELAEASDLPVIAVETATAAYRGARRGASGPEPFAYPSLGLRPDAVTWWGGGQVGFVHVAPRWFVPKPLTLVSTWDGDELSLVRVHHQLRAIRRLDLSPAVAALHDGLGGLPAPARARGAGLYRVVHLGSPTRAQQVAQGVAAGTGAWLPQLPGDEGALVVAPPLDAPVDRVRAVAEALVAEAAR